MLPHPTKGIVLASRRNRIIALSARRNFLQSRTCCTLLARFSSRGLGASPAPRYQPPGVSTPSPRSTLYPPSAFSPRAVGVAAISDEKLENGIRAVQTRAAVATESSSARTLLSPSSRAAPSPVCGFGVGARRERVPASIAARSPFKRDRRRCREANRLLSGHVRMFARWQGALARSRALCLPLRSPGLPWIFRAR